ncbi:MAG: hypothetical protein ABJK59_14510 [Erythrobacter sp.]|uniref:hypothetical protein n=1 Tax=Erythrobacter sp. TaxID=1042 RepID=UPI0032969E91
MTDLSVLSLVACALYAVVAGASFRAGREARAKRQQPWHLKAWSLITLYFVLLIILRLFSIEEGLREGMREMLEIQNLLADRRSFQGPIIAIAIALFTGAAMFAAYWTSQRVSGRRNIAVAVAIGACGAMLATMVMRTVSLHALDRLLNGPLKLNWVGDIGSSLAVLGAALFYVSVIRGKRNQRK